MSDRALQSNQYSDDLPVEGQGELTPELPDAVTLEQEVQHLKQLFDSLRQLEETTLPLELQAVASRATGLVQSALLAFQLQYVEQLSQLASDSIQNSQTRTTESVLNNLTTQLSSRASQLANLYRTATSVAHLPEFPVSYASLFESLLKSLYPAILYDISGVLVLQDAHILNASPQQSEEAIHLFLNQLPACPLPLQTRLLRQQLVETLSVMTGRNLHDLPFHLHSAQNVPAESELLEPEANLAPEPQSPSPQPLESQLIVPLVAQTDTAQETIGLLFIAAYEADRFSEEDIRLLYNAASHLAVSLQNLQLLWFRAEKQHLDQILNRLPTGVILLDNQDHVLFSNEVAKQYLARLGVTQKRDRLIRIGTRTIEELLQCSMGEHHQREITSMRSADLVYEVVAQPLTPGEEAGDRIIIIWDVSDRKRAEQEIEKALNQEKEANLMKSRVVRTISHEYKSPLAVVLGSAQTLKRSPEQLTSRKKKELLTLIENSARHLSQLVNEMLGLEEIESGKLELKPRDIDLTNFAKQIIAECRLTGDHRHIWQLSCEGQCNRVHLDPNLLRQILTNLLINAAKYSPQGGHIELAMQCGPEQVTFQVQDEGLGIPPDEQALLFESFFRATNVGHIRGSGLGLHITKKFVELHAGNITFESSLGQGSTFKVALPQAA